MNEIKFSSFTPKRIIVGIVLIVAFFVLHAYLRDSLGMSLPHERAVSLLGISSEEYGSAAPSVAPSYGGSPARMQVADKSAYMESGANGVAMDMVRAMPIVPSPAAPPSGESRIVKSADVTLLVHNVDEAAAKITDIRNKLGGQLGNASFAEYRPGVRSGYITIWVPSERFDEAMIAIKALAIRVENENVRTQDVSAQYVDLEARIKTLRAQEAQELELMKRAGKISEVLEVVRELNNTRTLIEQYQGQLNYLAHQVALSSIQISLSQEATPSEATDEWRPLTVIKAAMKDTLHDLTNVLDMLIIFLIKLPLLLLILGFWALLIWALYRAARFAFRHLKENIPSGGVQ